VRATPPAAERTIGVVAPLRKALLPRAEPARSRPRAPSLLARRSPLAIARQVVAVEIPVANPSSDAIAFDVSIRGDALYGDGTLVVPPGPDSVAT
jgi:hypothetical protein